MYPTKMIGVLFFISKQFSSDTLKLVIYFISVKYETNINENKYY